jgi:hypothetical protein
MSFNSSRLNDYNSKSYNNTSYIDYTRYQGFKKINIDYTIASSNTPLTTGPVFNANKITRDESNLAYTRSQETFKNDAFTRKQMTKEYNKIR